MAPEQLEGQDADARSDIFAFGVVLYEMLTGRKAFEGKSQASLISAILSAEPARVSEFQPQIPPVVDRIVIRCLAKTPEDRWQSVSDLGVPVMLVRGMLPQSVVDDDDERELLRRQPNARIEHVEGAGHSVQGDRPLELAALLADFLDGLGS